MRVMTPLFRSSRSTVCVMQKKTHTFTEEVSQKLWPWVHFERHNLWSKISRYDHCIIVIVNFSSINFVTVGIVAFHQICLHFKCKHSQRSGQNMKNAKCMCTLWSYKVVFKGTEQIDACIFHTPWTACFPGCYLHLGWVWGSDIYITVLWNWIHGQQNPTEMFILKKKLAFIRLEPLFFKICSICSTASSSKNINHLFLSLNPQIMDIATFTTCWYPIDFSNI